MGLGVGGGLSIHNLSRAFLTGDMMGEWGGWNTLFEVRGAVGADFDS